MSPRFQSVGIAQVVAAGLLGFVSCVIAADLVALLFAAGTCGLMVAAGVGLLRGGDPGRAGKLVAAVLVWLGLWAAYAAVALALARQRPSAAGVMTAVSSVLSLGLIAVLAAAQGAALVLLRRAARRLPGPTAGPDDAAADGERSGRSDRGGGP